MGLKGHTPFCFENMWVQRHSSYDHVKDWQEECNVEGWAGFVFMKMLKFVKGKLKVQNKEVFFDVHLKNESLIEMVVLDALASENNLQPDQG